jgi:membrane protein implicated in regulation of membrane protease activity
MRAFLVYNAARLGLFLVALGLLYVIGVGGLMLWALALVISGIASYIVLSRLRDRVSQSVNSRVQRATAKAGDIKSRIEEGARVEDEDDTSAPAPAAKRS